MKYCGKCGTQMNDDVAFCPSCGTKFGSSTPAPAAPKSKKSGKGKLAGIGIVAILAIIVVVALSSAFGGKKVDMKDYINVVFSGYDTVGRAGCDFDRSILRATINNLVTLSEEETPILSSLISDISVKLSQTSDLSNGDTIEVTVSCNEERFKKLGLKISNTNWTVKVKDLDKLTKLDPFEYVEPSYNGIAPNMSVRLDTESVPGMGTLSYSADPYSGLNIGDTFTVKVNNDANYFANNGYEVTTTEKSYKVENGDRYVTTCDELTEDGLKAMKKETEDSIEAYFAQNASSISATDISYLGTIVQMPKESTWNSNTVYLIYTAKVSSVDESFETQTVYIPKSFNGVIIYQDGIQDYDNASGFSGSISDMSFGWYSHVPGYNDVTKMFTELVRANKDTYEYSMSKSLEKIYQ